jgi:GWxTD domain-containing protein
MRHLIRAIVFILMAFGVGEAGGQGEKGLSPEHRRWLEEEVVYIITDREKEFFLTLETFEERESFIDAFWKKRDPEPATLENEFKEEHYRRIDFANTVLGKETIQPGWTTERGRYYIILGEPRSVERFVGAAEVVTCELWSYQGDPKTRLPPFFYLLFYKRHDSEDYRLYSPLADGPTKLILGERSGLVSDTERALQILYNYDYELAFASLSLDLGAPPDFRTAQPSLDSDIILAQAADAAKYPVRTDYIDTYLRYGKRVSADYSFNYIPSRSAFALLAGPDGAPFLHYSIEVDPQNFTFAADEDRTRYYTTLDVTLEVRTEEGTLVHTSEKEIPVELNAEEFDRFRAFPFAYQDDVPLVPGDFQVSVILRNRTVKQYTLVERDVRVVPLATEAPGLTGPILGYRNETSEAPADGPVLLTFQVGPYRLYPATDAAFTIGETVHIFTQVTGRTEGLSLRFRLLDEEQVLQESSVSVGGLLNRVATATFALEDMVGGRYVVQAELVDSGGRSVVREQTPLVVSPRTHILRPWAHRRSFDTGVPGLLALVRGEQFLALRRFEEAERELLEAVAAGNPDLPQASWRLAGIYIGTRRPEPALKLLLPLAERFPNQYEVIAGLGFAYHLANDPATAAKYLEQALSIRPPNPSLLNTLGDCYQRLGDTKQEQRYLERSLELNPDQEAIKKRLAALKTPE